MRSKVVVLLLLLKLFIVAPIICGGSVFGPCFVMQYLVSFILMGNKELVADYK